MTKMLFRKHGSLAQQGEIQNLERQVSSKDDQVSDLQKQVTRMQAAYQAGQREIENLKDQSITPVYNPELINGEDFSVGVVFKVQVGAFRKIDLAKYAETAKDFDQEGNELRKYIIGNFRNYDDAKCLEEVFERNGRF